MFKNIKKGTKIKGLINHPIKEGVKEEKEGIFQKLYEGVGKVGKDGSPVDLVGVLIKTKTGEKHEIWQVGIDEIESCDDETECDG